MIEQSGFFQANNIYPPPNPLSNKDRQNYDTLNVFNVEMDDRRNTVLWMDTSENIPTGITYIVEAIEKIASM
jgi:hypothetical protein